jgi:hypothetical protein
MRRRGFPIRGSIIFAGVALGLAAFGGDTIWPQDLFSWSSAGHRNITSSGTCYFSINGGSPPIVNFNQDPHGDFEDWRNDVSLQALTSIRDGWPQML